MVTIVYGRTSDGDYGTTQSWDVSSDQCHVGLYYLPIATGTTGPCCDTCHGTSIAKSLSGTIGSGRRSARTLLDDGTHEITVSIDGDQNARKISTDGTHIIDFVVVIFIVIVVTKYGQSLVLEVNGRFGCTRRSHTHQYEIRP